MANSLLHKYIKLDTFNYYLTTIRCHVCLPPWQTQQRSQSLGTASTSCQVILTLILVFLDLWIKRIINGHIIHGQRFLIWYLNIKNFHMSFVQFNTVFERISKRITSHNGATGKLCFRKELFCRHNSGAPSRGSQIPPYVILCHPLCTGPQRILILGLGRLFPGEELDHLLRGSIYQVSP